MEKKEKQRLQWMKNNISAILPFCGLVFVILLFQFATKGVLLNIQNLRLILNQSFMVMVLSLGATFIYASGGMDMAYGAVVGLSCMVGVFGARSFGIFWSVIFVLATAVISYMITGYTVTTLGIPPFVASMCIRYIANGIVTTTTTSTGIMAPSVMFSYDRWEIKLSVLVAVIIFVYFVFEYSKIGKAAKAIGGNERTTEQSGLSVVKFRRLCYLMAGLMTGVAAFFQICRTGSVNATTGQGLEMDVMMAVVLGGLPLSGGAKSKVRCAVLGACICVVLSNGLVLCGASTALASGIQGIVFLITVYISYERSKNLLLL